MLQDISKVLRFTAMLRDQVQKVEGASRAVQAAGKILQG